MSQILSDENGVKYILDDEDFMIDSSYTNIDGLNDVIYSDGTRAILVNGFFLKEEQAVLLQDEDDISQYFSNDGEILVTDQQNTGADQTSNTEIIHFIDGDGNLKEESEILYVNEDGVPIQDEDLSMYEIADLVNSEASPEQQQTQVLQLDEYFQQNPQENDEILGNVTGQNEYQYAILKDGKLLIQSHKAESPEINPSQGSEQTDFSNIKGRDLLTGQTVTLDSYIEKLQKKSIPAASMAVTRKCLNSKVTLKNLLNKKFNLGKTQKGKRLVGKVIRVENKDITRKQETEKDKGNRLSLLKSEIDEIAKDEPDLLSIARAKEIISENNDHSTYSRKLENVTYAPPTQPKMVSKESACFQQVSQSLSGLMAIENLKKKLQKKELYITVVEKSYKSTSTFKKKISHCRGHMEVETGCNEDGNVVENWSFVSHRKEFSEDKRFEDAIELTLIITRQKNNKRLIRVLIDPDRYQCHECAKVCQTNQELLDHVTNEHFYCEFCGHQYDSLHAVRVHIQNNHVDKDDVFSCSVDGCKQIFARKDLLLKHIKIHQSIALRDYVDKTHRQFSLRDLVDKKERRGSIRFYSCDICKRKFSRYSNLQRHIEIHKGAAEMYRCDICGCSYHYMSSLTRHVVNNHVKRKETDADFTQEESGGT